MTTEVVWGSLAIDDWRFSCVEKAGASMRSTYRLYGQEVLEVRTRPRPLVSDLDGARPFHARITGTRRRSFAHWCEGRGGLSDVLRHRPAPQAITVDNGSSADQLTGPQQRAHPDGLISRVRTRSSVSVP